MKSWGSIPFRLKVYIVAIVLIALPVPILALKNVLSYQFGSQWLILTAITLIAAPIFIHLPSARSAVTIGDAFAISICMLYGTSPAILCYSLWMVVLGLLLHRKLKTPSYRVCFNIAVAALNVSLYGFVYHHLNPTNSYKLEEVLIPAFALGMTFFLSNSAFVAVAVALSTGDRIFKIWRDNYLPLCIDFLLSACAGTVITLSRGFIIPGLLNANNYAPILFAPFVIAVWGLNKINETKAMQAQQYLEEQRELYLRTVESLALAVDAKDKSTYGHIRRVRAYALGLAKHCGITDKKELMAIETGSLLHDIGKLAIDDYILNKPGRLSNQEFEKIKMHAAAGDEILQQVRFPFPVATYVRFHHERWDGQGYPDGLKGEEIPLGARILAVADAYDAIRSSRPYKQSFGTQDSIELLRAQGGVAYDPRLVQLFIAHSQELEAAADEAERTISELSFRKYFAKIDRALSASDPAPRPQVLADPVTEELVLLFEFCNSFGRQLELADVLRILGRRLARIVPCSTCVLYLGCEDESIRAEHVEGRYADVLQGATMPVGKGISGWVTAYKRPMLNTHPGLDFQELKSEAPGLNDALVVPLVSDGDCLGTISLYAEEPSSFSDAHLSVLLTAATQVAPLIAEIRNRRKQPEIDPVTKAFRLNYLPVVGSHMITVAQSTQAPLSLLLVEIKNLSQLSNIYGSGAANNALRRVAEILRAELRETDVLVRYGYQGFGALLPGVRNEQASRCAQRLLKLIRETAGGPASAGASNVPIICQLAVASYQHDGSSVFDLLQTAHRSLPGRGRRTEPEGNIVEFFPRM